MWVVPAVSAGLAALVAPAELVGSAGLAVWVVSVGAGIARPSCRRVAAALGSIIRNIAEEPLIATARLQTGSAVVRAVTRSLIAKTRLGNKSVVRAAM